MKFTISILTYTRLDLAKKCLTSVLKHSRDCELILTSNGNPLAYEYFRELGKSLENKVHVVHYYPENLGFIEPNRRALQRAQGKFFVMLNDDCIVSPGWLTAMEQPFRKHPTCAMSGPEGGHFRTSLNPDKAAVEYIFGHCLMGRTALLKEVGLFSEYLKFAYWEEVDLQLRLLANGRTLHLTPDCKVQHIGKQTSAGIPGLKAIERRNFQQVAKRFPQYFGMGKWK